MVGLLSHGGHERARRFVFPADRHRFVRAHAAGRIILSRYTGNAPALLSFVTNAYGRPELSTPVGEPPLRFNLSHTHGLITVAVCRRFDVGVDVEYAPDRPTEDLLGLASRFFSPLEAASLRRLRSERRGRHFLQIWTLKEAYVKARGLGLSMPLDAFWFDLANDSMPVIRIDPSLHGDADAWRFVLMQPAPRHWLAVAVRGYHDEPRFAVREIALSEFLTMAS
jgi:4'-phosphopantetheinyl transferase